MNTSSQGTPKSLRKAIQNGLESAVEKKLHVEIKEDSIIITAHLESHIRDFLSQKFGAAMMADKTLSELWESIIGE